MSLFILTIQMLWFFQQLWRSLFRIPSSLFLQSTYVLLAVLILFKQERFVYGSSTNLKLGELSPSEHMRRLSKKLFKHYAKEIVPLANSSTPVDVAAKIHINDMVPLEHASSHYSIDFYFRLQWKDYRLAYKMSDMPKDKNYSYLPFDVNFINKVWYPNVYFPNGKSGKRHEVARANTALVLYPDGTIINSERLSLSSFCPMKMKYYPFDIQECTTYLELYAYNNEFVHLKWVPQTPVTKNKKVHTADFNIVEIFTHKDTVNYGPFGNYDRLHIKFRLHRNLALYFMRDFFPIIMIVMLSWVSFWISYKSTPARVALGITTVLTVVTMSNSIRNNSHAALGLFTSLHWYLLCCNLFVIAALSEYAIVGMTLPHFNKIRKPIKGEHNSCVDVEREIRWSEKPSWQASNARQRISPKEEVKQEVFTLGPVSFVTGQAHIIDRISRVAFPVCFLIMNGCFFAFHRINPDTV